jgi:hypothetical protein
MNTRVACVFCLLLMLVQGASHGAVITIRTGQVNGTPGACPGLDDSFRYYAPNPDCAEPILPGLFQPSDFDQACAGPQAVNVNSGPWIPSLPSDPRARWINWSQSGCDGDARSVLYCAAFQVPAECTVADSVRIYWAVDDALGDSGSPPGGVNSDGVYINGVSLGSAFSGGPGFYEEQTAVAYNVPINGGANHLAVYQRDYGCTVAGLMLSCTLYTSCGSVPIQERSWGSMKALYR